MSRKHRKPSMAFAWESLEARVALSHMGAAVEDGTHHHRGRSAEIHVLKHGADDPANHDANDDKGGNATGATTTTAARHGADDSASHNANDDKAGTSASTPTNTTSPQTHRGRAHRQRGHEHAANHR